MRFVPVFWFVSVVACSPSFSQDPAPTPAADASSPCPTPLAGSSLCAKVNDGYCARVKECCNAVSVGDRNGDVWCSGQACADEARREHACTEEPYASRSLCSASGADACIGGWEATACADILGGTAAEPMPCATFWEGFQAK